MPIEANIMLIIFFIVIMIPAIIVSVISIKNHKQHISKKIGDQLVEIIMGFYLVKLMIDGKIVDEVKSLNMTTIKLQGIADKSQIIVNIGIGFLRPKIMTYIDGEKDDELSNC